MIDELVAEAPSLPYVDRSTLERFVSCPAMARYVQTKQVITSSFEADSGNAVHDALSIATQEWVSSAGRMGVRDLSESLMQFVAASRPDVQPDAIEALRFCAWPWARFLSDIHPENIIRFDGGEGDRSGQLAFDMPDLGLRITSEVDLLYAGPSKEVIHEVDYKSGRKVWFERDVGDSFQFCVHAWLILHNYPDVEEVEIRVWSTRRAGSGITRSVRFKRDDLYHYDHRLRSAAMAYKRWRDTPPEQCDYQPQVERCSLCPAAALCPATGRDIREAAMDRAGLLGRIVATSAVLAKLTDLAEAIVDQDGEDIIGDGVAFGLGKPSSNRKPTKKLYTLKSKPEESNGDGSVE